MDKDGKCGKKCGKDDKVRQAITSYLSVKTEVIGATRTEAIKQICQAVHTASGYKLDQINLCLICMVNERAVCVRTQRSGRTTYSPNFCHIPVDVPAAASVAA